MFLLAIHFYQKLSLKLVFRTGNAPDIPDTDFGKVCIQTCIHNCVCIHNSLSAKHSEAILG